MAVLDILHYPDPRLHTIARPVTDFNPELKRLVSEMAETMYEAPGIGLAATQVNVHLQVVVIDISEEKNDLEVFINPRLVNQSAELKAYEEGCLSVPGIYDEVERPDRITVTAQDVDGRPFTLEADDLLSVCLQHEMDHLRGKVFVQYLSRLKQGRIKSKMLKRELERAGEEKGDDRGSQGKAETGS
jgi:peptide deformylase